MSSGIAVPYTLLKFLLWFGLAALIGGGIGWLLRSLKSRAEVANARAAVVDDEDVDRMRHRLANLEQVVAERDRLRMQVADLRAADSPGVVGAAVDEPAAERAEVAVADELGDDAASPIGEADDAEADEDQDSSITPDADNAAAGAADTDDASGAADAPTAIAGLVAVPDLVGGGDADGNDESDESDESDGSDDSDDDSGPDASDAQAQTSPDLDLRAAAAVLGKKIKLDDLTAVEGIGPKISELCRGIGIDTWRALADTDLADLRSMLDAAGSRYQIHKPESWPGQAELLATGQWDAFVAMTAELDGGR